jgi:electron transfer flavoprotein beta subunit
VTVLTVGPRGDRRDPQGAADGRRRRRARRRRRDRTARALATSLVLAEALKKLEHDLVVCGMASTDAGMSVVPAMVAERLGLPR